MCFSDSFNLFAHSFTNSFELANRMDIFQYEDRNFFYYDVHNNSQNREDFDFEVV